MLIDNNACIAQINAVKGVTKARAYIVKLRQIQEAMHMGIMHTKRVDSRDNIADVFTKCLGQLPFWRLTTHAMGDRIATHAYTDYRDLARETELSGGSIRELQNAARAKREKAKVEGKADKARRREAVVASRREQTAMASKAIDLARELLTAHAANEAADGTGGDEAPNHADLPDTLPVQGPLDPGDEHTSPVKEDEV